MGVKPCYSDGFQHSRAIQRFAGLLLCQLSESEKARKVSQGERSLCLIMFRRLRTPKTEGYITVHVLGRNMFL